MKDSPGGGSISARTAVIRVLETDGAWCRVAAWRQAVGEYMEGWVQTDKLTVIPPRLHNELEFPSDGTAGALEACGRESAGTSWQGQAGVFRNTVFVRTDTELAPDDFSEERCGDGGSLFQRLCLAAAADSSLLPFTGICYFSDTDAALDQQYTAACTETGLSCTVRSASPGLTKTWRLTWSRQPDGTFRKDDSFQYREKRRD